MTPAGFIGLGLMGTPMALNMLRAGTPLVVWNRTASKCDALVREGAQAAQTIDDVFRQCDTVFLMLADASAVDAVLSRGSEQFAGRVRGRTVVHMGSTSPEFSRELASDVAAAGGTYVECPISGSRVPAERGELVAMIAGDRRAVEQIVPLLKPVARDVFTCGDVPNALLMKLAVNIFLMATVIGLAEAANFAQLQGLDMQTFRRILDAGQMASTISAIKIQKIVQDDFSAQAAARDAFANTLLIAESARATGIPIPLLEQCCKLLGETVARGYGHLDMAAVKLAFSAD
jgi:3-hydroxyisobutyrate dehydrogenase